MMKLIEVFRLLREGVREYFDAILPNRPGSRYDKFSQSFPEFKRELEKVAEKYLGKDWKDVIDTAASKPGVTNAGIKKLWEGNYSDYEAQGEIGFWYDLAQTGGWGAGGYGDPVTLAGHGQVIWNDATSDYEPRPGRPIGSSKKGGRELIFGKGSKAVGGDDDEDVPDL